MIMPATHVIGLAYGLSEVGLAIWKRSRGSANLDAGSEKAIWITIACSMIPSVLIAHFLEATEMSFSWSLYFTGVAFVAAGIALRWWSILWLGKFFTTNVAVANDHKVVDTGPYSVLRHPSYTGTLMVFFGLALCLGNWLSLAVIMIPITVAFIHRIKIEERSLSSMLGKAYTDYAASRKRLIPLIY